MKTVLNVSFIAICMFQLGMYYGSWPYSTLLAPNITAEELSRISMRQSYTSLVLSLILLVLAFATLALPLIEKSSAKKSA